MKVSVLMTVYNEEKFLRESLDSVLAQDETDFELVIVDDASTDNSPAILKEYSERDSRVRVSANPQNNGLIKSRITALEKTKGEYVMLVDADDYISSDAISSALRAMKKHNTDTAIFDLQMLHEDGSILPYSPENLPEVLTGREAFALCVQGKLHGLCLEARGHYNALSFDDTCRLYSDDNTAKLHYYIASRVCLCEGKYFYRQHPASETHSFSIRRFDYLLANISLKKQMLAMNADSESIKIVEVHRWKNIVAHYKLLRENKHRLTAHERHTALKIIGEAIHFTDFRLLPLSLKLRPPYWPAHSFRVFILWQKLYYLARKLLRKNIK